ncbi:head-tail adaptor protein [Mesorhizobium sp. SB112]|uniref:head-tail adaptor protein n=1 Tax=Mesorhizobium sp. SB112 TaxID=3151853 RepID=UPI00326701A9
MRAGKLDRVIAIERQTEIVSATGGVTSAWTKIATTRAEVLRRLADEITVGFGEAEIGRVTFRFRWRPGIRTADRIIHDGIAHDIKEIVEIGRRRTLEVRAVATS